MSNLSIIEQAKLRAVESKIPKQIRELPGQRFVMVRKKGSERKTKVITEDGVESWETVGTYSGKEPHNNPKDFPNTKTPWNWRENNYSINDDAFIKYLPRADGWGLIGGGKAGLVIVDFDNIAYMKKIYPRMMRDLPTFVVKTGSGKLHAYYQVKDIGKGSFKCVTEKEGCILELRGEGLFCVGPGSKHPSGNLYRVPEKYKDMPIRQLDSFDELLDFFMEDLPEMTKEEKEVSDIKETAILTNEQVVKRAQLYGANLDIPTVASVFGAALPPENMLGNCPTGHASVGGKCFSWAGRAYNCFHCGIAGNPFDLAITLSNGNVDKAINLLGEKMHVDYDWNELPPEYGFDDGLDDLEPGMISDHKIALGLNEEPEFIEDEKGKKRPVYKIIARNFWKKCPYHYTTGKLWYLWKGISWHEVDETDLMIQFDKYYDLATESASVKNSLLEAFRKYGRAYGPKEPPKTWVQFNGTIIDYRTKKRYTPSPDYFMVNVVPHDLPKPGGEYQTPIIDGLIRDWVGNRALTVKEFMAHMLLNDYIIQQLAAFIGYGSNGKTTLITLMERILGRDNVGTTTLPKISGRFESGFCLLNKNLCIINELDTTKFNNTATLKEITGGGTTRFEKKGGGAGTFTNYAKIVIACNQLPQTTDKTDGNYRRWLIVEFPNKFTEKQKNLIEDIPEEEIQNFCYKAMTEYLPALLKRGYYDGDSVEGRKANYERLSNDPKYFFEEYYIVTGNAKHWVRFDQCYWNYNDYCKNNGLPKMSKEKFGALIKNTRFEKARKSIGGERFYVIMGLQDFDASGDEQDEQSDNGFGGWSK